MAALRLLIAPIVVCSLLAALPSGPGAAQAADEPADSSPDLDARAWVLIDARDGTTLAAHRVREELPIASLSKLMTAYLTLEELPLDREIKAPAYDAAPAESVLGLQAGERLSVRDLLVAMMLPSANDAAFTLADGVSGSRRSFIRKMNSAARELGLEQTSYANPIGLDDPDNYSSAADLAALATELLGDKRFAKIVAKPDATLKSSDPPRRVETRNTLLLSDPSVVGVKTGHTNAAGYVLVAAAERHEVPLISVVLGTSSEAERDAASAELLDYGFSLYEPREAVARGERLASAPVRYEDRPLALVAGGSERVRAREDQSIEVSYDAPGELEGPIPGGERMGRALVLLDGERVGAVPVLAGREIDAPDLLARLGFEPAWLIVGGSILLLAVLAVVLRRARQRRRRGPPQRTAEERISSREHRARQREEGKQA